VYFQKTNAIQNLVTLMTLLFRLALVFLFGGIFSSCSYVYLKNEVGDLEDRLESRNFYLGYVDREQLKYTLRASELAYSSFMFQAHTKFDDSVAFYNAKHRLVSMLIQDWTLTTNSLEQPWFKGVLDNISELSREQKLKIYGANTDDLERLDSIKKSINAQSLRILGIPSSEIEIATGQWDRTSYANDSQSYIDSADETFADLLIMSRVFEVFRDDLKKERKAIVNAIRDQYDQLPYLIVILFIGQFGIFIITGYVDWAILRRAKQEANFRFRMILACCAAVASGVGFIADQILLHLENQQSQILLDYNWSRAQYDIKGDFFRETHDLVTKSGNALAEIYQLDEARLPAAYAFAKQHLMVIKHVVDHFSSSAIVVDTPVYQTTSFSELMSHRDMINQLSAEENEGNLVQYWGNNVEGILGLFKHLKNDISNDLQGTFERFNALFAELQKLGDRSLYLIVVSVLLQAISLFLIIVILREDPETPV
jgi:hypothetical protein